MNSPSKPSARKGFALPTNEEDRRKWTEQLDKQLPRYKQSKREIGRILKELKAVYCRPGCQGLWKPFLESRGLAMSTANDLIARYTRQECYQEGSPQFEDAAFRDPETPSRSMQMRLNIPPEYRDRFRQGVERLGRDLASSVILLAVIQAVKKLDMPSAQFPGTQFKDEPVDMVEPEPLSAEEYPVEFTGSGKFNPLPADPILDRPGSHSLENKEFGSNPHSDDSNFEDSNSELINSEGIEFEGNTFSDNADESGALENCSAGRQASERSAFENSYTRALEDHAGSTQNATAPHPAGVVKSIHHNTGSPAGARWDGERHRYGHQKDNQKGNQKSEKGISWGLPRNGGGGHMGEGNS